ncbi:GH13997 [Drosophila grimshawi]|uniref:GH13997 n=1 Tax=Drosophila grimshawi TaxID=7222 RepID=B4JYK3_DROGR|nr:GH13997 [Drosophila grimshawi]
MAMASENKNTDLKQIQRPTQRGLKKCATCGAINGSRALLCRNPNCPQHKNVLDGVQLVCRRAGCTVYSLRSKEQGRETQARNFVCIEDVTLSLQPNAAVVSSKAICYVVACKSDNDCRHIKACREGHDQMPKALVYTVSREVLWNLNISLEQKQKLWQQYKSAEEEQLPAVQRLNPSTFVVKCQRSDTFSAGHLHVTALANGVSTRKANYACACRKLKIIVEPDNSLVMQDEICDHLLLVLAGILSSPQGKTIYGNFTKSLHSFWMPDRLETPLGEATHDDLRLSLNINICGDADPPEDIYIFGDEFCVTDSDLSDLIYDVDIDTTPAALNSGSSSAVVRCANDAQLLSNCDIYAEEEQEQHDHHLELTDCNIELMDQYQLTDQIDLCSEDIELPLVGEPYNILAPPAAVTNQLPAIELTTFAVVKKPALKASEIVDEVKTRKQPPLPAKRALIVNEPTAAVVEAVSVAVEPALAYAAWLEYVIELLNESIEPATESEQAVSMRQVLQQFHVHKETFSHFSKSFSAGIKRRPLHQVSVLEAGKHKGLTKYVWHFSASHTVKRIFSSRNVLQLERCFERNLDGQFVPYVRQAKVPTSTQTKQRQVHTRLRLYMINMLFDAEHKVKSGMLISWIPDVLPRSNFGLMDVEFTLQTRAPI